ncbi:MAG: bifunctional UDP-sugar hydrolase/5'-nucleotidase [Bacteroidota bacterium]
MKRISLWRISCGILTAALFTSCAENETVNISIVETTDIHGVILPWDYTEGKQLDASLASTAGYVKELKEEKDAVFLLDNGDNLQGQPCVYYYNFIDTTSPHLMAEAFNRMEFDASTVGNHDIEAGHAVYDRLARMYSFPLLAANAIDLKTGEPYFKPYVIIEKAKIKIAVLGLITPVVPTWLPEELYSGMEFSDMVKTAEKWMPEILKHKPDVVVGLFHSGWNTQDDAYKSESYMNENGTAAVAWKVPGFDIILCGHDHRPANEIFVNSQGDTVLILNGGSRSELLARADIEISTAKLKGKRIISITGELIELKDVPPDASFISEFSSKDKQVRDYVDRVIGTSTFSISSRDSYFGPCAFTDMIHSIQLQITGADISFAAPLSFDVEISKGPVRVGDMFKLYRYENMLYTMTFTGIEVQKYLEYSYSEWINTMKGPGDYLLQYRVDREGKPVIINGRAWLANAYYNFDSGAGLNYTVDVSKPEGSRVKITSLSNGEPFKKETFYTVALNSYRGNGGGGHLTRGAGIKQEELLSRVLSSTDRDLRYYILKYIEEKGVLDPQPMNNWKLIPENWVSGRVPVEYSMLFGTTK